MALEEAGRREAALSAYQRARDLGEALFRANSRGPQIGHELARNLGNMGINLVRRRSIMPRRWRSTTGLGRSSRCRKQRQSDHCAPPRGFGLDRWLDRLLHDRLGRKDEAIAALGRAREARELLIKANPAVTRNREQLIRVLRQTADIHRRAGRMSDVLASLQRAQQVAASLVEYHPQNRDYRLDLATAYTDLGDAKRCVGQVHGRHGRRSRRRS